MKLKKRIMVVMLITVLIMTISIPTIFAATNVNVDDAIGLAPTSMEKPEANQPYLDPVFGTEMVRISDSETDINKMTHGADSASVHTMYSYWPSFNSDSTRIYVGTTSSGHAGIYSFDADTMKAAYETDLYNYGDNYQFDEAIRAVGATWSATNPDIMFGLKQYNYEAQLVQHNVVSMEDEVIKNFVSDGDLPEGYPVQISKARDNDRYFAFHWIPDENHNTNLQDDKNAVRKAIVYDRELDDTYSWDMVEMGYDPTIWRLDEVRLDHKGKYLQISLYNKDDGSQPLVFWGFANQMPEEAVIVNDGFEERGGQHYDIGENIQVQADRWSDSGFHFIKRDLDNPKEWTTIAKSPDTSWQNASHVSALGPDDSWVLVSTYSGFGNGAFQPDFSIPFTNEIFMIRTDGSGDMQRLAHTYATTPGYAYSPFANISPDGRFFAYTSNWMYDGDGSNGTLDVYVGRIDEGVWESYIDTLPEKLAQALNEGKITDEKTLAQLQQKVRIIQKLKNDTALIKHVNVLVKLAEKSPNIDQEYAQDLSEDIMLWTNLYINNQ